jgi:hypothetical protein
MDIGRFRVEAAAEPENVSGPCGRIEQSKPLPWTCLYTDLAIETNVSDP